MTKDDLRAKIKGLHITSILHNCPEFDVGYKIGDPIILKHFSGYPEDEYDRPPIADFPGHFLSVDGTKLLVFVKNGQMDTTDKVGFEARANGFCKVPKYRVAPNPDGIAIEACLECGERDQNCTEHYSCPFKSANAA